MIGILATLFLGGCVTSGGTPGATYERIQSEMKGAVDANRAASADAVNQALLPPLQLDVPKAAPVEPRFDLAVTNAPASQVFMALVSGTRYSMLVPPEVAGSITVNLKNVTLREALESLRDLYGYDFRVQGNRITVMSNAMQTRVFQVNYLAGRRQGSSDVRVTSSSISVVSPGASTSGSSTSSAQAQAATAAGTTGAGAGATRAQDSSRIYTSQDADFWTELKTALGAIVGTEDGRNVIINAHSGVILVRAMPGELRNVEQYLRATQAIIERQVMLEAKIIDVALSDAYQSGINWASFSGHTTIGVAANGTSLSPSGALTSSNASIRPGTDGNLGSVGSNGFFGLAFRTKSFAALLNFLETQGNTQVLSSPRIATLNNQKAVLKVGTDEYYVTNVSSTTIASTTTTTTPTVTLQPFFSGIALDVTPQINETGLITLHIHPSISVVSSKEKKLNLGKDLDMTLPLASSEINESDTIVRVRDGEIVAIGGLMKQDQSDTSNGLPGIHQVPVLGNLFGQKSKVLNKRELVILLKPTVIQNESDWQSDLQNTQSRIDDFDPRRTLPQ
ncbi:pilus (MSHA type) biogenesis protein MshL [Azospira oryzae]|uniref:pilus (MSHA type) biogenesis protein MshL n=1 Tax=Azospira oryzae TaxID=146939 RepID=UPI001F0525A8|nr:pilus (MSHA type) biogenesis protein MshL [Azospira oryzae]